MSAPQTTAIGAASIRASLGQVEILHDISINFPAGCWSSIVAVSYTHLTLPTNREV